MRRIHFVSALLGLVLAVTPCLAHAGGGSPTLEQLTAMVVELSQKVTSLRSTVSSLKKEHASLKDRIEELEAAQAANQPLLDWAAALSMHVTTPDKDGDGEADYVNITSNFRVAGDVHVTNDLRVDGQLDVIVGIDTNGWLEAGCITDHMSCLEWPYCNNNKMCNDYDDATLDACEWSMEYTGFICTNTLLAPGDDSVY